eukprot:m.1638201 g.1638201  ORF g.1638201 m.1638201 type:complete len:495 (-) comp27249_c0_seq1:275-1759(-)
MTLNPEAKEFIFSSVPITTKTVTSTQKHVGRGNGSKQSNGSNQARRQNTGRAGSDNGQDNTKGNRSKLKASKSSKGNSQHRSGGDASQASENGTPNAVPYVVDGVNVSGLNYSPTGAQYSPVLRAHLKSVNYAPTGQLYSPWARFTNRIQCELVPSKREAIRKQIDFYFGDSNFPKDKFLLKASKKRPDSFIAIKVIADFPKVKKLTTSWRLVAKAIEGSAVVELNDQGNSIRRQRPLPNPKVNRVWHRTVVIQNLATKNNNVDTIKTMCSVAGTVDHVRFLGPGASRQHQQPPLPIDMEAYLAVCPRPHDAVKRRRTCALVEFASDAEAMSACAQLNDSSDWRRGVRVSMLWPVSKRGVPAPQAGSDEDHGDGAQNNQPAISNSDGQANGDATDGVSTGNGIEGDVETAETRKARRLQRLYAEHPGLAKIGGSGGGARQRAPTQSVPPGLIRRPFGPGEGPSATGFGAGRGKVGALSTQEPPGGVDGPAREVS